MQDLRVLVLGEVVVLEQPLHLSDFEYVGTYSSTKVCILGKKPMNNNSTHSKIIHLDSKNNKFEYLVRQQILISTFTSKY